jgi:DHA2 family methylenomycin A resistance protein-like MFS transporter
MNDEGASVTAGTDLGLADRLRRPSVGFAAICLGYFAIILDGSVLNVAVPAIRADFHGSLAGAQWVLNAYTLTLAGLLLTAGALGDRVGLRRMFLVGASVFTAASAAPSERRIAELAAAGSTNREIAQTLFVTAKTVETHLGHAYTKLGISSRVELEAALR